MTDGDVHFGQDLYACVRRMLAELIILNQRCLGGMEEVQRMIQQRLVCHCIVFSGCYSEFLTDTELESVVVIFCLMARVASGLKVWLLHSLSVEGQQHKSDIS